MGARIEAIEYHLPDTVVSNDDLAREYPDWSVDKIFGKTGIAERRVAAESQCASDLAVEACGRFFARRLIDRERIDYLIVCTQSPDYFLPATACVVQHRVGLPTSCGAIDVNQGCSGWVYAIGTAKGLIESGQAANVLIVTAETYSKFIAPGDRSVRTIFGDAAAVSWLSGDGVAPGSLGAFVYGTDGGGANNLIVRDGAARAPGRAPALHMDGPKIFEFTMTEVPRLVARVLDKAGVAQGGIDLFAFHQANKLIVDSLRSRLRIPEERILRAYEHCGNTVSSTIPIALRDAEMSGRLKRGMKVLACGFGVGYSWAGCVITW